MYRERNQIKVALLSTSVQNLQELVRSLEALIVRLEVISTIPSQIKRPHK